MLGTPEDADTTPIIAIRDGPAERLTGISARHAAGVEQRVASGATVGWPMTQALAG